jgi:hypothetical protein
MVNTKKTKTDALSALITPSSKSLIPGMNFINLKALKILNALKTNKNERSEPVLCIKNVITEGTEMATRAKSNLFQFTEK